jgi:hypothetical protein
MMARSTTLGKSVAFGPTSDGLLSLPIVQDLHLVGFSGVVCESKKDGERFAHLVEQAGVLDGDDGLGGEAPTKPLHDRGISSAAQRNFISGPRRACLKRPESVPWADSGLTAVNVLY